MNKSTTANDPRDYITITIAVLVGLVGVFFRFLGDSFFFATVSNVFLIIGIIIVLRGVFTILK